MSITIPDLISGPAFSGPDPGTWTFGGAVILHTANESGGSFAVTSQSATETFNYTATDGDHLSGDITWTKINDSGPGTFFGIISILSKSGIGLCFWMRRRFDSDALG